MSNSNERPVSPSMMITVDGSEMPCNNSFLKQFYLAESRHKNAVEKGPSVGCASESKFAVNEIVEHKHVGELFIVRAIDALVIPSSHSPIHGRAGFQILYIYTLEKFGGHPQGLTCKEGEANLVVPRV